MMFNEHAIAGLNYPAIRGTILICHVNLFSDHLMRTLFLLICVVAGLSAGLWFTGALPNVSGSLQGTTDAYTDADSSTSVSGRAQRIETVLTDRGEALSEPAESAQPVDARSIDALPNAALPNDALPNNTGDNQAQDVSMAQPASYHDGIMRVAPAVVSVYASNSSDSEDQAQTSQGSGVIVAADGIVLTNLHLIQAYTSISVVLNDGRTYPATLMGSDVETDLAVVQIAAEMLPFVKIDEAQPLRVGDIVLAIGNPFGVGQTVTQGIVSATRRRLANASLWQNFVQIDAAINPGNSGGALINSLGQLVGVNTAVFRGDSGAIGIGFAIPAELLAQVVPQIIENGSVSRGWLGLGAQELNMYPGFMQFVQEGAVITSVKEGSPAYLTGVQPLDVVVQLGEQPIRNATQFLLAVSALPPGATVKLVLLRSPDPEALNEDRSTEPLSAMTYKVVLGTRPSVSQLLSSDGID